MDISSTPSTAKHDNKSLLKQVTELLRNDYLNDIRYFILNLYPAEIAHLIESLQPEERKKYGMSFLLTPLVKF